METSLIISHLSFSSWLPISTSSTVNLAGSIAGIAGGELDIN
jgi:hypothetical protein